MPDPVITAYETPTWLAGILTILSGIGGWFAKRPKTPPSEEIASKVAELRDALLEVHAESGLCAVDEIHRIHRYLSTRDSDGNQRSLLRELTGQILERLANAMEMEADAAQRQTRILERFVDATEDTAVRLLAIEQELGIVRKRPPILRREE